MTRLDLYLALALYAAVLASCAAVNAKPELTPVCAQACAVSGPED